MRAAITGALRPAGSIVLANAHFANSLGADAAYTSTRKLCYNIFAISGRRALRLGSPIIGAGLHTSPHLCHLRVRRHRCSMLPRDS